MISQAPMQADLGRSMVANPRSIPEIREAIVLFEDYERSGHDFAAAKKFVEAVVLLNDFLEAEPDTEHRSFVQRLKLSNTRSMLRNLAKVDRKDGFAWAGHVGIFMSVDAEAKAL